MYVRLHHMANHLSVRPLMLWCLIGTCPHTFVAIEDMILLETVIQCASGIKPVMLQLRNLICFLFMDVFSANV